MLSCLIQVNSSSLVGQVEVPGTTGSMVKYPGQESLYTNVGLTSTADVATSVRGDTWCPMALAWTVALWDGSHVLSFSSSERHFGVVLKMAGSSRVWGFLSVFGVLTISIRDFTCSKYSNFWFTRGILWLDVHNGDYQHHSALKDSTRERVSFGIFRPYPHERCSKE